MIADLKSPINNPASRKQVERAFFVHTRDPIDAGGMLLTPIRGNLSRDGGRRAAHGHVHMVVRCTLCKAQSASSQPPHQDHLFAPVKPQPDIIARNLLPENGATSLRCGVNIHLCN